MLANGSDPVMPPNDIKASSKICFNKVKASPADNATTPALPTSSSSSTATTPADASSAASSTTAVPYYCIRGYKVNSTVLNSSEVTAGEQGYADCAEKCSELGTKCVAFAVAGTGTCSLISSVSMKATGPDTGVGAFCFKNSNDWLILGSTLGKYM